MRVTTRLKGHFDWVPVPQGVVPSTRDVELGKAKMGIGTGGGWLMRVNKTVEATHETHIAEREIIAWAIGMAMPAHPGRPNARGTPVTRAHAVADYIDRPDAEHFSDTNTQILGVEVHDEADPATVEAAFRDQAAPLIGVSCGRTGKVLATPESVEAMVKKYLEPADASAHAKALHAKYGVQEVGT